MHTCLQCFCVVVFILSRLSFNSNSYFLPVLRLYLCNQIMYVLLLKINIFFKTTNYAVVAEHRYKRLVLQSFLIPLGWTIAIFFNKIAHTICLIPFECCQKFWRWYEKNCWNGTYLKTKIVKFTISFCCHLNKRGILLI